MSEEGQVVTRRQFVTDGRRGAARVHDRAAPRARARLPGAERSRQHRRRRHQRHGRGNTQAVMSQNIVAICDCRLRRCSTSRLGATCGPSRRDSRRAGRGRRRRRPAAGAPRADGRTSGRRRRSWRPTRNGRAQDSDATLQRFVDEQLPRVKKYRDYREMLEKQKDIDAVIIATPDHMHAVIASAAMALGKHVYVQKPMCWSVHEARHLAKKARRHEGRHADGQPGPLERRRAARQEYIMAGAIGDVREVHVWTNRPLGFWPQGIPRPARDEVRRGALPLEQPRRHAAARAPRWPDERQRIRCPTRSRGICSSASRRTSSTTRSITRSTGAAGWTGARARSATWARTSIDYPVWALKLGLPTVIETELDAVQRRLLSERDDDLLRVPGAAGHAGGEADVVRRRPHAAGSRGARASTLDPGRRRALRRQEGQDAARTPLAAALLPIEKHNAYGPPKEQLPRVPHHAHEMNWVNAIRGKRPDLVPVRLRGAPDRDHAARRRVAARRTRSSHYDAASVRVTNNVAANEFLTREYRQGWSL